MNLSLIPKKLPVCLPSAYSATIWRGIGTDPKVTISHLFNDVNEMREKSVTPSKLLMVWRVAPVKHRPYWEKDVIRNLGIDRKLNDPVIVKNTPSMCEMLMSVKHIVRVKPVVFPYGEPAKDGDFSGTKLKQNGEFIVSQKLKVDPQRLIEDPKSKVKIDRKTIERELTRRWAI